MEDRKLIFAKNLVALRRKEKLTQAEFAEKINYSDKAVSKWERAESVPDVTVLVSIARFFGVTLDFLVTEHENAAVAAEELHPHKRTTRNRSLTYAIVMFGILLVEMIVFFAIGGSVPSVGERILYCLVFPLPAAAIVSIVLCSVWDKKLFTFLSVSALVWALIADAFLIVRIAFAPFPWIFLVGFPAEVIVAFSFGFIRRPHKKDDNAGKAE